MVRKQLEKFLAAKNSVNPKISYLKVEEIKRNPFQPRQQFNRDDLTRLAQSILSYGLIQPVIVRRVGDQYQLVAGERRLVACTMIGLREIPAIIREMDDEIAAMTSLVENLQRKELNYFEEANAYSFLMSGLGMTLEEISQKVGLSPSAIAKKIHLLKLSTRVRIMMVTDIITEGHARALLKLKSTELQIEVLKQIYERGLTVKETEQLAEKIQANNIPREIRNRDTDKGVSIIIRDARIFVNTIKETVKRGRETGIDILIRENDGDEQYEINIKIPKNKINTTVQRRSLA